jgi:hypothetical protein
VFFYGQCSEICGVNHGFMPIVVEGLTMYDFLYRSYVNHLLDVIEDNPDLEGYDISNLSIENGSVLNNIKENFISK